jgi:hypothetical protein
MKLFNNNIRAGDLVEIRTREEILATLDEQGGIDGMPFMPEMLRYCGQRFRVEKVAHKTCDTIHYSGNRRVPHAVHLEGLRCDGAAHGGCQAACLFFWKLDWLKHVEGKPLRRPRRGRVPMTAEKLEACKFQPDSTAEDVLYKCQVTELLRASRPWAWWNPTQYLRDITTGNNSVRHVLGVLALAVLRKTIPIKGYKLQVRLYNYIARRTARPDYHSVIHFRGPIPNTAQTPNEPNTFKPGDWVVVKPVKEIAATLNRKGQNRGMFFDSEMVPHCGRTYKVSGLVTRLIHEPTGRMMEMKNPCIALEGAVCRSEYSGKRLMCPRGIVSFWRPNWLEKAAPPAARERVG